MSLPAASCITVWWLKHILVRVKAFRGINVETKAHQNHDDVIKWKHFPRDWPFVREIHRSPVNFPHKGQWRGALMFSLVYAWINDWVNNREAGDLRRQHGHYDVIVMCVCHPNTNIRAPSNQASLCPSHPLPKPPSTQACLYPSQ